MKKCQMFWFIVHQGEHSHSQIYSRNWKTSYWIHYIKVELIHCSWYYTWKGIRKSDFSWKKTPLASGHDEIEARHIRDIVSLYIWYASAYAICLLLLVFTWRFGSRQKTQGERLKKCYSFPRRFWTYVYIHPFMIAWWHSLINSKFCLIFNSLIGKYMVMISITVYDQMIMSLQHGSYSIGVYIDFSVIFDTMNNVISFKKLQYQRNCLKMDQNLLAKLVSVCIFQQQWL